MKKGSCSQGNWVWCLLFFLLYLVKLQLNSRFTLLCSWECNHWAVFSLAYQLSYHLADLPIFPQVLYFNIIFLLTNRLHFPLSTYYLSVPHLSLEVHVHLHLLMSPGALAEMFHRFSAPRSGTTNVSSSGKRCWKEYSYVIEKLQLVLQLDVSSIKQAPVDQPMNPASK